MLFYYKNSFLASAVSILGCIFVMIALMGGNGYEIGETILLLVLGVSGLVGGKLISNEKAFKKWWKQVEDAGLEDQIRQSAQVALQIYKKNPKKRTIKQIEKLNPEAAAMLRGKK